MHHQGVLAKSFGFFASLLLSLGSFFIFMYPEYFGLQNTTAVVVIYSFALVQFIVQMIFFIDVWNEGGTHWNIGVFFSTLSIIFIVVFFSIWIMYHLNANMMPPMHH